MGLCPRAGRTGCTRAGHERILLNVNAALEDRVRKLNHAEVNGRGRYVLYWAQVNRRVDFNQALMFAADLANELDLPLLYLENLDCEDPEANDRWWTFVLEGVPETARRLEELGIGYVFHLRQTASEPGDVAERLAAEAAAVVTDDYPVEPGGLLCRGRQLHRADEPDWRAAVRGVFDSAEAGARVAAMVEAAAGDGDQAALPWGGRAVSHRGDRRSRGGAGGLGSD
jgi:hypothetical protein